MMDQDLDTEIMILIQMNKLYVKQRIYQLKNYSN